MVPFAGVPLRKGNVPAGPVLTERLSLREKVALSKEVVNRCLHIIY